MSDPNTQAPPLPPRRSPALVSAPLPLITDPNHTFTTSRSPPPLPPRSSPSRPALPSLLIPEHALPAAAGPLSGVSVSITPATPTQNSPGGLKRGPSDNLGQSSTTPSSGTFANLQTEERARLRPTSLLETDHDSPLPSSPSPSLSHPRWPASEPAEPPPNRGVTPSPFKLAKDWIPWLLFAALALNLLYARISSFWLLVLAVSYLVIDRPDIPAPAFRELDEGTGNPRQMRMSTALKAIR